MALITVTLAADKTGVPKRTIQWAIKNQHLPAQMIGASYLIDEADLNDWIQGRTA